MQWLLYLYKTSAFVSQFGLLLATAQLSSTHLVLLDRSKRYTFPIYLTHVLIASSLALNQEEEIVFV